MKSYDQSYGKPFNLSDADIAWVQKTLAEMDLETKVGQLFFPVVVNPDPNFTLGQMREAGVKPGWYMSRPFAGAEVQTFTVRYRNSLSFRFCWLPISKVEVGGHCDGRDGLCKPNGGCGD